MDFGIGVVNVSNMFVTDSIDMLVDDRVSVMIGVMGIIVVSIDVVVIIFCLGTGVFSISIDPFFCSHLR